MTQKEITTKISVMYLKETGLAASSEIEIDGEYVEVINNEYACWLEKKLNELLEE